MRVDPRLYAWRIRSPKRCRGLWQMCQMEIEACFRRHTYPVMWNMAEQNGASRLTGADDADAHAALREAGPPRVIGSDRTAVAVDDVDGLRTCCICGETDRNNRCKSWNSHDRSPI